MILQVMWPSFKISPDVAGTKLMGRRGMAMLARACLASSSMVELELFGLTALFKEGLYNWKPESRSIYIKSQASWIKRNELMAELKVLRRADVELQGTP